ncbi:MAG TPA: peptidylprolyl isomerase [Chitinophagaceae bacterium]|nr:peptidylprolyl isomerase [Chitinophagaceae bacterium]
MKKIILFVLLSVATLYSQKGQAQENTLDKIVAIVGDNIILKSEIETSFEEYQRENPLINDTFKCHILEQTLLQKVLLEQAALDSVSVSDDEIEGALNNRIRYFVSMYGSEEKMEEMAGKTIYQIKDEYRPMFKDKMLADKMQNQVMSVVKITPQEVKAFYDKVPKDSLPYYPSMVEVGEIVFKPKANKEVEDYALEQIQKIRKEIANGSLSFESAAGMYSEDPGSKDNGGDLGIMSRDELDPEFAAAAFRLQNGEMSDVVKSSFGFHIIQMINRQGEKAKLRHILKKPLVTNDMIKKTMVRADSIRANLISGKIVFSEAVNKYSDDENTKYTGGMFSDPQSGSTMLIPDELDAPVALAVNDMKVGEYSQPIEYIDERSGDKLVRLIYLKKRTEPHKANLQEDYNKIQQAAFAEKQTDYLMNWLETKIPVFYIKIDEEYGQCPNVSKWNNKISKKNN